MVDSAYNLIDSAIVTSSTTAVDLDNMSSSYDVYYFVLADVKFASTGYLQVKPKVSNSVVTGFNSNTAGMRRLMTSGNQTSYSNSTIGGTREYIAQTGYQLTATAGGNEFMEGWIMNSQSDSHNTYLNINYVGNEDSNIGHYGHAGWEYDDASVLTGIRINASTGNILNGKFYLYGLDKA